MTFKNYISFTAMAVAMVLFNTPSQAQNQDGWILQKNTMTSASLASVSDIIHPAYAGSRFLRLDVTGSGNDSVVWTKGGFSVPCAEHIIKVAERGFSNSDLRMSVNLHHQDTTVVVGWFYPPMDSLWRVTVFNAWTGLSQFDSISIVLYGHNMPNSWQRVDLDNFLVTINGQDSVVYDGGERTVIRGNVFYDANQNGVKDSGEIVGLSGWTVYAATATTLDSAKTNGAGTYQFLLKRGTYQLYVPHPGWTETTPDTLTVVGESDTVTASDWGMYQPNLVLYQVQDGWNLFALPLAVSDASKTTLLPNASSSAFAYEGSYVIQDTLYKGIGYWVRFSGAQNVAIAGDRLMGDTVVVTEGWNLIGAISTPVLLNTVTSVPPGITTSHLFGYNQGYIITDTLQPGQGYWIKAAEAGQLIIQHGGAPIIGNLETKNYIHIINSSEMPPPPPDGYFNPLPRAIPRTFLLAQNYPNPFNPTTTISFSLPTTQTVRLIVYNILGQEVITLIKERMGPGSYATVFDASGLSSGIYIYQLQTESHTQTHTMVLIK